MNQLEKIQISDCTLLDAADHAELSFREKIELCRLIDGLGGAFGLVLGMAGSCALLLFVSLLSFLTAVSP